MNDKFFSLPAEKQQAILNAGYRVFSRNSYKNSPMSEIAGAAGISKALLFHYFHNKKELYLYLWEKSAETTIEYMTRFGCYDRTDLFDAMELGTIAKLEINHRHYNLKVDKIRLNLEPDQFIPGLDIPMMYREMYWAAEGYLWEMLQQGDIDIDQVEKDFRKLMAFWKNLYKRKE